jgi:hypothetical protein
MIRVFRKRASILSELRGSTADRWASRTTAGSRSACRWPPSRPACLRGISLYLPENWAGDAERRRKAGVPEEVRFQTKQEIALDQIRSLREEGVERGVVLADAAYGNDHGFREELEKLELEYVVGIQSSTSVWPPGTAPLPPKARKTTGRPAQLLRRDQHHQPLSVKELALCLSPADLRRISWREGTRGTMHSRFACLRIRVAHRDILAQRTASGAVAADRMAQGGERADEVLAVEPAGSHPSAPSGSAGQTAMDHRARLSGTQTGTWSGTF